MEIDFQVLIYIVFVVIAILSRFLKSKKKKATDLEYENEESNPSPKRATSFEDLLKEFTGQAEEKPSPELNPVELREEKPIREYDFSSGIPTDSELDEVHNESSATIPAIKKSERKVTFGHFKGYEEVVEENEFAKELKEMLSERNSAAKAIVLSEIINRKY